MTLAQGMDNYNTHPLLTVKNAVVRRVTTLLGHSRQHGQQLLGAVSVN